MTNICRSLVALTLVGMIAGCGSGRTVKPVTVTTTVFAARPQTTTTYHRTVIARKRSRVPHASFEVLLRTLRIVDPSRTITTGSGTRRRAFTTIIRFPVLPGGVLPSRNAPFPLIVFGHGFSVSPQPYSDLLDAWAKAGYVVAAPVFPLENGNAPGGPNEKDLVNQPRDMSLVISQLLAASGSLGRLIDPAHLAVAGQSDGGDTALASAYDPTVRDPRINAAVILSGAEDPFAAPFAMPRNGPPLLAIQGTADTINPPAMTYSFFRSAAPPKFLLRLLGAGHQLPYTQPGPDLTTVERMSIAFLDYYLKRRPDQLQSIIAARTAGGNSALTSVLGG